MKSAMRMKSLCDEICRGQMKFLMGRQSLTAIAELPLHKGAALSPLCGALPEGEPKEKAADFSAAFVIFPMGVIFLLSKSYIPCYARRYMSAMRTFD